MLHGYLEYLIDKLAYQQSSEIIACLQRGKTETSAVSQHDAIENIIRDKWRLNYVGDRVTFSFFQSDKKKTTVSVSTFLIRDCQLFPLEATNEVAGEVDGQASSEVAASLDPPFSEGAASLDLSFSH
jgi:hypothetical protein